MQFSRPRLAILVITMASAVAAIGASSASAAITSAATSNNWSGYVASGTNFSSVSGSWIQPAVNCSSPSTYSAYWVGLGGTSGQGGSLEQTGTQADCTSDGRAYYYAWYELVPSGPVTLGVNVSPGDRISASVSVNGSAVTVSLSDQTTGASATRTLQMSNPDTSSADWITEAPSACDQSGSCSQLPLANFGTVQFSNATATASGHTGPISDPSWTAQPVVVGAGASATGFGPGAVAYQQSGGSLGAQPSGVSSDGMSFSVTTAQSSTATTGGAGPGGYPGGGYAYTWGDGYLYLYGQ